MGARPAAIPGITSAMGLLATDMVYEYVVDGLPAALDSSTPRRSSAAFEELEEQARAQLEEDGIPADQHPDPADRRLPLPRPGLRASRRRRARGTIDEAWVEKVRARLPRHPRARVLPAVRRVRHRDPERPRPRHRPDAGARDARGRDGRRSRPRPRSATRRDAWFRVDGELAQVPTRLLRPRGAEGRQPPRRPGDREPVRLDHGDPARGHGARRPLREHRDRAPACRAQAAAPLADSRRREHERCRVRGRAASRGRRRGSASRSIRSRCACSAAPSTRSRRRWRACSSG